MHTNPKPLVAGSIPAWGTLFIYFSSYEQEVSVYHLCKTSRLYIGNPYYGLSSNGQAAQSRTLEGARFLKEIIDGRNPVGFDIYDAESHAKVEDEEIEYTCEPPPHKAYQILPLDWNKWMDELVAGIQT
jgi:hypothetical protein